MKARKTLKHQELCVASPTPHPSVHHLHRLVRPRSVMEVIKQIGQRFKVEPAEIKKVRRRISLCPLKRVAVPH